MDFILHIDTSADIGTVALSCDGALQSVQTNTDNRNHAGAINIMIDEVLAAAHITLNDLSAITVCAGPGSYTGLRIGMATAKALCYVLDKPLMLNNKLTLLAFQQYFTRFPEFDIYVSILNAREKEYFIAAYDKNFNTIIDPRHVHLEEINDMMHLVQNSPMIAGDIDEHIKDLFKEDKNQFSPGNIIDNQLWSKYAYQEYKCNSFVNLSSAEPFYLKQVYTHKPSNNKALP